MRPDRIDQPLLLYPGSVQPDPLFSILERAGYHPAGHPVDGVETLLETAVETPHLLQLWWVEDLSLGTIAQADSLMQAKPLTHLIMIAPAPLPERALEAMRAGAGDIISQERAEDELETAVRRGLRRISARLRTVHLREYGAARAGFNQGAARLLHDMNSPLTAIQSAFEMIEMEHETAGEELNPKERLLHKGIDGGRSIADQWHDYLYQQTPGTEPINLYQTLHNAIDILLDRRQDLEIVTDPMSFHPAHRGAMPELEVPGDPLGYELIFWHVLLNAAEALEDTEGGRISVKVREDGQFIIVTIEDNGPGIHPDVRETLWKDFQTTKPDRFGMGLGIVRYLLMMIGGSIRFARQKTLGGAAFEVELRLRPPRNLSI
jgi:C4-dicarboxylate-specific signal transduction histidine kinase